MLLQITSCCTLFSQQLSYLCSGNEVFKLDINNCTTTSLGSGANALTDIALTPSGNLYGIDFYNFYSVNTTNGSLTLISTIDTFGSGFNSLMGYNDEYVLAVRINSGLYKIHTNTGDTTLIGMLGYYPSGDLTRYKEFYYMADAMNQLIRFKLDFANNAISDIEVVGTMNTPGNAIYGIVTVGTVTCESDDLQIIAFEGTSIYSVNPDNANCLELCPSSSNIGASGAASSSEIQTQLNAIKISIPNIFTPNNDGINDYFEPSVLAGISNLKIEIVNRWGNSVYSTQSDIGFKWDGISSDGETFSNGVYFYKLIYWDYCEKQEIVTGFIQLEK